ncbi:MAG: glycosyltransferase family 4 protein [Actinomycetota bacterium]
MSANLPLELLPALEPAGISRTLVVTNDFPPRVGGAQRYVHDLVRHLPTDRTAVLAPTWPGWEEFDENQPFPVFRFETKYLAPVPDVLRRVRALINETESEVVLFGHGLPLAMMGPRLVADPGRPYAVLTHGAEVWAAGIPGSARALWYACSRANTVFAVSKYTAARVRPAVPDDVPLVILPPGVDAERFRPDITGQEVRERYGLVGVPVALCISRLVTRKGQDVLIRGWRKVLDRVPEARLLLVGDGPSRSRLEAMAAERGISASVTFAGQVSEGELPSYYAAGNVFVMPCRSRKGGLEVEGFGIVFLEAAAVGLPVVVGNSGGAAEAVEDGETGLVVDGTNVAAVASAIGDLLEDPARAATMGKLGRLRVEQDFAWPRVIERLAAGLAGGYS